jgi:hypothetical protein
LNALVGVPATQAFTITIDKAQLSNVDLTKVNDIVMAIEYTADPAF